MLKCFQRVTPVTMTVLAALIAVACAKKTEIGTDSEDSAKTQVQLKTSATQQISWQKSVKSDAVKKCDDKAFVEVLKLGEAKQLIESRPKYPEGWLLARSTEVFVISRDEQGKVIGRAIIREDQETSDQDASIELICAEGIHESNEIEFDLSINGFTSIHQKIGRAGKSDEFRTSVRQYKVFSGSEEFGFHFLNPVLYDRYRNLKAVFSVYRLKHHFQQTDDSTYEMIVTHGLDRGRSQIFLKTQFDHYLLGR